MAEFSQNLQGVTDQIALAAEKAGRALSDVKLIAVSKTKPIEVVQAALDAGVRIFGENRVQEAVQKFTDLRSSYSDIELHLIGPLQTNKAADAVALFDVIQTLDRPKLAAALAKEIVKQGRIPQLYIQVNSGAEPQKAGVLPEAAAAFYKECVDVHGLKIDGLMCLPPHGQDPTPFFAQLKALADELALSHISMGMSGDYELAIGQGATEVRVGSALFGQRN